MSDDARHTQAMPPKGAPSGESARGERDDRPAESRRTGGSDAGAPYPGPRGDKARSDGEGFADGFQSHGGQSVNSYHGTGQLGRDKQGGGNRNAGSREDDGGADKRSEG